MAYADNRPQLAALKARLVDVDLTAYADATLQALLDASIAWVEDVCTTKLNGLQVQELYDGNNTKSLTIRKKPVTSVVLLTVTTPILGFIRTYQPTEIKLYRKQGEVTVFTYKLAVEQALFNTLDYQAWGTILPPLPQCVTIQYTYGYPQYDAVADQTTLDGGTIVLAGDQRDPEELNWLSGLQQAALCDAQASFLGQLGSLKTGFLQSVSFDGYSRSMAQTPYQATIDALIKRRDELLKRRRRQFFMSTVG